MCVGGLNSLISSWISPPEISGQLRSNPLGTRTELNKLIQASITYVTVFRNTIMHYTRARHCGTSFDVSQFWGYKKQLRSCIVKSEMCEWWQIQINKAN